MKAVDYSAKTYFDITGEQMSNDQKHFLIEIVGNLSDTVITSLRTGKMRPMDVAQLVVGNALSATGVTKDDSAAGNYMDCGLALVALALTSVEMYGIAVTSAAAASATGPATAGLSLAADAGVLVIGVLYWNYMILNTSMRCAEDFRKIEYAVPARFNLPSQRANYTNAANSCSM